MSDDKHIDENECIARYKSTEDQKFLVKLFESYSAMIYGVCMKYLNNRSDAEDAFQSIYMLVKRKLLKHEVESFRPWVYVLTKNYCFDILRRKKKQIDKENEANFMYSEQVFHPDSTDENQYKKLNGCIEKLNEEQNLCVKAFYFEGMTYHQVAEKYDWKWSKVRSLIQNGRRMIKNCLEK